MALDTKVVKIGSAADIAMPRACFRPRRSARREFPKVKSAIEERAVDAVTLAAAVAKDKDAAGKQYGLEPSKSGVAASTGAVISVKFTGVVGKGESGEYDVEVEGVPSTVVIRVQTGPAINGTDLRDATGAISFAQFDNQIEYQNAGSALNSGDEETGSLEGRHGQAHGKEDFGRRRIQADAIRTPGWSHP